jgi:2-C-methyl-D-erythritol 2,4-cyclodiphosphate synthase
MNFRIGEGWDVHALVPGRRLVIGGVEIAHSMGLLGHSDADVLLHAITDALLGAAALGDIGSHFPDTDAAFRGADSGVLLAEVARRVRPRATTSATSTARWWRRRRALPRIFLPCAGASRPRQVWMKRR